MHFPIITTARVHRHVAGSGMRGTTADAALSEEWLARTDQTFSFYRRLRDQYDPGKPMWVTETADAACGGNPWASTFLDSFRYLDQLGRLAKQGVQVVMHNTLDASDYGLLDENTLEPRPNYWAALFGENSWEQPCSKRGSRSNPAYIFTRTHCAACPAAWCCSSSTATRLLRER